LSQGFWTVRYEGPNLAGAAVVDVSEETARSCKRGHTGAPGPRNRLLLAARYDPASSGTRRPAKFRRSGTDEAELRDPREIPVVERLSREIRIPFRSLRRALGFAIVAIMTLGLAIGANSAIFSAVNIVLFGVVSYGMTVRTQEIGIRMALGAKRSQC
jgi:hypothetical protein